MVVFKNLTQERYLSIIMRQMRMLNTLFILNNSNDSFIYETLSSMQFTINIIMS